LVHCLYTCLNIRRHFRVDFATSNLPEGWRDRLVKICNENTNNISGLCLEIHDLIISKLYAGREKDLEFFHAAVRVGLLSKKTLIQRLSETRMAEEKRNSIIKHIEKGFLE
jgi:hypothetical protein